MAHYVAYWRSFWDEEDDLRQSYVGWGSSSPNKFKPDDVLWIFVRVSHVKMTTLPSRFEWRLVRKVHVAYSCTQRDQRYTKFPFRVVADIAKSIVFINLEQQQNAAMLLKSLCYNPYKPVPSHVDDARLGKYFQRIRQLQDTDIEIVIQYASSLPRFTGAIWTTLCTKAN